MTEEHIRIDENRFITVPKSLQRIAVQNDHNVETVTFDCPRYWDGRDMSQMRIYINYMCADKSIGMYLAKNITISDEDDTMMHFDWTISRNATKVIGQLSFLVCIKKTDEFGYSVNHWNSELNQEMYISEGLECEESILEAYPDVISYLLTRQDFIEGQSEDYVREHVDAYFAENPFGVDDTLKTPGLAADAAVTGTKFDELTATVDANDMSAHDHIISAEGILREEIEIAQNMLRDDIAKHNREGIAHQDIRREISSLRAFDVGAYSKEETINSTTRELFGLGDQVTPADVFARLGMYYWKRRRANASYSYTFGDVVTPTKDNGGGRYCIFPGVTGANNLGKTRKMTYSKNLLIDPIGHVCLDQPMEVSLVLDDYRTSSPDFDDVDAIARKAEVRDTVRGSFVESQVRDEIYYIPEDADFAMDSISAYYYLWPTKLQPVTISIPDRKWEYLLSDNKNAHPKQGIVDGYEYVYLGSPLQNAVEGCKIAGGQYVGTGTVGEHNPMTITFDFTPKIVAFYEGPSVTRWIVPELGVYPSYWNCGVYSTSMMWYGSRDEPNQLTAPNQLNEKDKVYRYVAWG